MAYKKIALITLLVLVVSFGIAKQRLFISEDMRNFLAATFFTPSITVSDLRDKYTNADKTGRRVKILLVPGHEPDFGGTEFDNLKERDMNVDFSLRLKEYLENDKRFEVIMTRDKNSWNPELEKYFNDNREAINDFIKLKKTEMNLLVAAGKVRTVSDGVQHNSASNDAAYHLFGINRWSSNINVDILIHVHFNDYPRAHSDRPGAYKGFVIYIPDKQYSNSVATKKIAADIFKRLEESFVVSDLPKENAGIVENQDLIAIGQSNSLDAVSLLIEYGYIYRPQFALKASRDSAFNEMAKQTYLGLEDFFK